MDFFKSSTVAKSKQSQISHQKKCNAGLSSDSE